MLLKPHFWRFLRGFGFLRIFGGRQIFANAAIMGIMAIIVRYKSSSVVMGCLLGFDGFILDCLGEFVKNFLVAADFGSFSIIKNFSKKFDTAENSCYNIFINSNAGGKNGKINDKR